METTGNARLRGSAKGLARIAPTYFFMYFLGPVVWRLWMTLRLGFVSLEESRRCLISPYTISIAAFLLVLNTASMALEAGRSSAGQGGAARLRMAIHCASLLALATIGTAVSMSALSGSAGGGRYPPLKLLVGSLNGASMCFAFYAASTASVIARLATPGGRSSEGERRLFAIGMPLFMATSLAAASLGGGASSAEATARLLASMAVPVTMGGALFVRADRRIASLLCAAGKELAL